MKTQNNITQQTYMFIGKTAKEAYLNLYEKMGRID